MLKKIVFAIVVLGFAFALAIGSYSTKLLKQPLAFEASTTAYYVKSGASLKRVLNDFANNGWIEQPRIHELWLRYQNLTRLQKGEYEFAQGLTSQQAIEQIIAGKKVLRSVQFIEGKTFADNLQVLANNPFIEQTLTGLSLADVQQKVSSEIEFYEGWFFPDTYLFEKGTRDIDILKISHERMQKVLAEEWAERSEETMVKSAYEALILASIIEKETGAGYERPMISGVFTRRLQKRMRLQTDPTVIYGVGEGFDGNLTRKHLRTDTPYNTYTRGGLPPTPIANPGREAIWAALHPAEGSALFFVAKGDGSHYFSDTLEEHNAAVRRYQRFGRRSDYQSAPSSEENN